MRGVAVVAILTLALGIGATTTMFSVVYAALLRPPPFAEPDAAGDAVRHRARRRATGCVRLRWSRPEYRRAAASASSFEASRRSPAVAASRRAAATATPEQIDGEMVSSDYFGVLARGAAAGRVFRRRGRHGRGRASGGDDQRRACGGAASRRSGAHRRHASSHQRRAADGDRHPARGLRRPHRQGRRSGSRAPMAPRVDLLGLPDDAAALHQRRRAAAGRSDARARQRRARGDRRRASAMRPTPPRGAVGRGGAADRRRTGRAGDAAIGAGCCWPRPPACC